MTKRILSTSTNKTKTMYKPLKTSQKLFKTLRSTPFLVLASLLTVGLAVGAPLVRADQFDDQINTLQAQNAEVDQLLASEKSQNDQLAAAQAEQNQLLSYNESQQAAYNAQIASNSSKISDLRRQQAIENAKYNIGNFKGDPNNGGYPR